MSLVKVTIDPLESGYVVTEFYGNRSIRRAEPTLEGALTISARALGYNRVVRFDQIGTLAEQLAEFSADELPLRAGGTD